VKSTRHGFRPKRVVVIGEVIVVGAIVLKGGK
jgi:hypothetical protein